MSERLTYTVDEAAKVIGVSRGSAYELVRRGELRSVRAGHRVLVPRIAVCEFLGLVQEQVGPPAKARPEDGPEKGPEEAMYLVTIRRVALER